MKIVINYHGGVKNEEAKMSTHAKANLIVVAGLAGAVGDSVVEKLVVAEPDIAVVHHTAQTDEGVVDREIRTGVEVRTARLAVGDCCVSCTIREDVARVAVMLAKERAERRIVVHLPPSVEPDPICWALRHTSVAEEPVGEWVCIEAVMTTVDEASWLGQATSAEPLPEFDALGSNDHRSQAEVAIRQVEFADALVYAGFADEASIVAPTKAVLARIAPRASHASLADLDGEALLAGIPAAAPRGALDPPHAPILQGQPPLQVDRGVALTLFSERRPFHPQRFFEVLDILYTKTVRTRGRVWIASQPDSAFDIETDASGVCIGYTDPWLFDLGGKERRDVHWDQLEPNRSTRAAVHWDPYYGDREQVIALTAQDHADTEELHAQLHGALLTEDELSHGQAVWRNLPDPFTLTAPAGDDVTPVDQEYRG